MNAIGGSPTRWLWTGITVAILLTPCLAWPKDYEISIYRFGIYRPVLTDARGVVGLSHRYKFQGGWDLRRLMWEDQVGYLKKQRMDERFWNVYFPDAYTTYKNGIYVGDARWDRKTGEMTERIDLIEGNTLAEAKKYFFGRRIAKGKCLADPFLGPQGACEKLTVQWEIPSWDGKPGPIGLGLAHDMTGSNLVAGNSMDLTMAQALSQMHKDEPPPATSPPPAAQQGKVLKKSDSTQSPGSVQVNESVTALPPASQSAVAEAPQHSVRSDGSILVPPPVADQAGQRVLRSPTVRTMSASPDQPAGRSEPVQPSLARGPTATFSVEAEQLVQANETAANGGKVVVQPMAGFGSGWSGNAQLFWSGGTAGAVLDLLVNVPAAATYVVELHMTRAPDYADFTLEVDGKSSSVTFSGYAPTVMAPTPVQAGNFTLQAGTRKISLMITGKSRQSTGYVVGIDQIKLYPARAP